MVRCASAHMQGGREACESFWTCRRCSRRMYMSDIAVRQGEVMSTGQQKLCRTGLEGYGCRPKRVRVAFSSLTSAPR